MSHTEKPLIDVTNINEKVYEFIKRRIIDLTYPPGRKINSAALRQELGISQTPIKDALSRLAGEQLVEISSRRGTYVKDVTDRDIQEIAEIRIILETGAVEMAAGRITKEKITQLEALYENTLNEPGEFDYRSFMERDSSFHMAIVGLTDNQRLLQTYKRLNSHAQVVRSRFGGPGAKKLPKTDRTHKAILEALKKNDTEKAKVTIRKHIIYSWKAFLERGVARDGKEAGGDGPRPSSGSGNNSIMENKGRE